MSEKQLGGMCPKCGWFSCLCDIPEQEKQEGNMEGAGIDPKWQGVWAQAQLDASKPWHWMQILPNSVTELIEELSSAKATVLKQEQEIASLKAAADRAHSLLQSTQDDHEELAKLQQKTAIDNVALKAHMELGGKEMARLYEENDNLINAHNLIYEERDTLKARVEELRQALGESLLRALSENQ